MPCPKPMNSLESLCRESVAKNLGKVKWLERFVEGENKDLTTPLMLAAIMKAVKEAKGTTRKAAHLGLLVTKYVERLDLSSFPDLTESLAVHLLSSAALQGSPLKTLRIRLDKTPYNKLQHILPHFLRVLDLSNNKSVNDTFLSLIAKHCTKLESLDLQDCLGVTDVGLQRLCLPHTTKVEGESVNDRAGGIQISLLKLDIRGTEVTEYGTRVALQHLKTLEVLEGELPIQVIGDMVRDGERRPLTLIKLDFYSVWHGRKFDKDSLATAITLCPSVVHVDIEHGYKPSSQDLRSVLNLDNLQRLILREAYRISFYEDLLPVLKKFGHESFDYFDVSDIQEMNLRAILEHCSKLRCFYITNVLDRFTQSTSRQSHSSHLPHLKRLQIQSNYDFRGDQNSFQPSADDLALLLASAPALLELKLEEMDNLSDGIFEQAIVQHGFPCLEELEIVACPNVTKDVVDLFLELHNPLSSIAIERYKQFYDCEFEDEPTVYNKEPAWKEKIARNNFDLSIYYCGCNS